VTHPSNHNPFDASFVNHICEVTCRPVTMTGQSFVEMKVSFMTEPEVVASMQLSLTQFHEECLDSLVQYLGHRSALPFYQTSPRIGISSRPVGSYDLYRSSSLQVGDFCWQICHCLAITC